MKTLSVFALLAVASTQAWADDAAPDSFPPVVTDEVSRPGENGHIDVGLGIESRFGLVFQLTLVDRNRGIYIEGLAIPVTALARPTATGLAGFTHWCVERAKERREAEKDDADDPPKTASKPEDEVIGGQTLPSAYHLEDDVQYFPAGPEFRLEPDADGDDPWYEKYVMSEKAREIERNLGLVEPRSRGLADVEPSSAAIVAISIANPSAAGFAVAWQSWELVLEQFTPEACGPFEVGPDALE